MDAQGKLQIRKSDPRLLAIAGGVLAICLFYIYINAFWAPTTGLGWNLNWNVIDVTPCVGDAISCETNSDKIRLGDQLQIIGDLTFEEYTNDRRLAPFYGYEPGDLVPITLERASETIEVDWRIPTNMGTKQIEAFLTPLLIFGPFWIVGTVVLLFMQPHNIRWRLMALFSYLTALWIAIGMTSLSHLAYSSLFLHALTWILIPVYIHLHLVVPKPLYQKNPNYLLLTMYIVCGLLAIAELVQALPGSLYLIGFMVAALASICLLVFCSFFKPQSADRLASRLMLTGVVLAFGPGLILWIVPTLLGNSPGQFATVLALLAIPILPFFYGYAIYKHQLGIQEARINRLLATYAQFLVYVTVFGLAFIMVNRWLEVTSELLIFLFIISLALMLALFPLRHLAGRVFDRLAYGTEYSTEQVVHYYASRIPAVNNDKELLQLLTGDLMPTLHINQSALLWTYGDNPELLYQHGLTDGLPVPAPEQIRSLKSVTNVYLPQKNLAGNEANEQLGWVRLVVPLQAGDAVAGLWLFGNREPDDYYSKDDIELLNTLGRQVAISIENARLIVAFQNELVEKERAEENLERYAERLKLLHDLDQAIVSAESPQEIAEVALQGVRQLVPCVRTSVILFDFEKEDLIVLAYHGAGQSLVEAKQKGSLSQIQQIILETQNRVVVINNLPRHAGSAPIIDLLLSEGILSTMMAHLVVADKPLGTLNFVNDSLNAFTSEHVEIAREVASSLAAALHNAQLRSVIAQHRLELQQLSSRLISAQENERKRISYELHDEMGQLLTAITFNLAAIENATAETPSAMLAEKLEDTKLMVDQLMNQVRSLSLELRPTMLQDLGIVPTIRWYINAFSNRTEIDVDLETLNVDGRFSEDIETALYRIMQEALTNVLRHAEASQVRLCLERHDAMIKASINDDGKGFDVETVLSNVATGKGVGLVAIRERVTALDGRFDIRSTPGEGTVLSIEIPIGGNL